MTKEEQLKQLDKLLSEAFTEVKDNYGMPNSHEVTKYLLEHGVEVHYMKDNSNCWKIDDISICTCPENMDCEDSVDCKYCQFLKPDMRVIEGRYWSQLDDCMFGKTVFTTKEEAEAKLKELLKETKDI